MREIRPLTWLRLAFGSIVAVALTFFIGAFAGGHEIDETCAAKHEIYDEVYRSEHWLEPSQVFPMHNKCNADFDLVPFWVNPALVIFAVLTVAFVVALIMSIVRAVKIPSG
jgi:hypothetical protein